MLSQKMNCGTTIRDVTCTQWQSQKKYLTQNREVFKFSDRHQTILSQTIDSGSSENS